MQLRSRRLLITGASGAGTTTLGRAIAVRWSVPHADIDDYFWTPTSPPYTDKRPVDERLSLMHTMFLPRNSWVLSGSLMEWGEAVDDWLDGVVFLTLDHKTRMDRLKRREVAIFGETIKPGGVNEKEHLEFLDWARGYDDDDFVGRSRVAHERWLAALTCPVLRLDGVNPVPSLADAVVAWTDKHLVAQ